MINCIKLSFRLASKNKKSPVSAATPTGEVTENQDEVIFQAVYIIIPPECAIFKNRR